MRIEDAIGQLLCPTLFGGPLRDHPYDAERIHAELDRYRWGGYILFHGARDATRARLADLQAASRVPLLIAADMEHGAGQQIQGLSVFPTAMAFGAIADPQAAYDLGAWTAAEALSVGINWILAPVADVTNNPRNPIINIRSFGGAAEQVARRIEAFIRGCQDQGALACAKHFPGHGDTETDSHSRLGVLHADRNQLDQVELPPFRAAIRAGVATLMTAHLAVPALGTDDRPATVSREVMTGLLREELGFDGLIVTDALVMGGITRTQDPVDAAVDALLAGCDMLLMPPDPVATYEGILRALDSGRLPASRILEAANRVLAAKSRLGTAHGPLPQRSAQNLALEVARGSLTAAKGDPAMRLPPRTFALAVDDGVEGDRLAAWREALARHDLSGRLAGHATNDAAWREIRREAEQAEAVLIGVFSPIRVSKDRSLLPQRLVERLREVCRLRPTTVISFSSPFLVAQFPEAAGWVLAYGSREFQIEAAIAALRNGSGLPGRLPVVIPTTGLTAPVDDASPPSGGPAFA
jgi:beta-glucosidase-like glycosyl hydrolase